MGRYVQGHSFPSVLSQHSVHITFDYCIVNIHLISASLIQTTSSVVRTEVVFYSIWNYSGGAMGKNLSMQETLVQSLGQEDPLEEEAGTHSSILAWEIPWPEKSGGLQSMGHKETYTTEHRSSSMSCIIKHKRCSVCICWITAFWILPFKYLCSMASCVFLWNLRFNISNIIFFYEITSLFPLVFCARITTVLINRTHDKEPLLLPPISFLTFKLLFKFTPPFSLSEPISE